MKTKISYVGQGPVVTVEFHGKRFVHFQIVPVGQPHSSVVVGYHDLDDNHRVARVATDEVNKDARRPMSMLYSVNEDSANALSALVDASDPSMATIRGILAEDRPDEKAKELLAAAYGNEVWPKEFRDTLKLWMQIDDEAEDAKRNDSEVPLGVPDPEFDNAPATASLGDSVNPLPSDRWPVA